MKSASSSPGRGVARPALGDHVAAGVDPRDVVAGAAHDAPALVVAGAVRAGAEREPVAVLPVGEVVAALAAGPADVRDFVLAVAGALERRPSSRGTCRRRRRRAPPTSRPGPSSSRSGAFGIDLEQVERRVLGPIADQPLDRLAGMGHASAPGSHNIRSRLTLSKPAARASATASAARSALCSRPSRASSSSRNDCTPKLSRVHAGRTIAGERGGA